MSQVDDWSDGYTSDYLRDLNTYGPASANVPRPSSVVSHQVQYQPPVAQTEARTNDTPMYTEDDARGAYVAPASGYRAPAGGGWDVNSSDTNLRFSNESGGKQYRVSRTQAAKKSAKKSVKKQSQAEYHTGGALTQDESNVAERAASHRQSDFDWGELNGQALDAAARFLPALKLLGFGAGAGSADTASSSIEDQFKNMPWYKDAKAHHEAVKKNMDDYGSALGTLKSTWDDIPWWTKLVMLPPVFKAGSPAAGASTTGNVWAEGGRAAAGDATAGAKAFEEALSRMNGGAVRGAPVEGAARSSFSSAETAGQSAGNRSFGFNLSPEEVARAKSTHSAYVNGAAGRGTATGAEAAGSAGEAAAGSRSFRFDLSPEAVAGARASQEAFVSNLAELRSSLIRSGMPDREVAAYMQRAGFYNNPEALQQAIFTIRKHGPSGLFERSADEAAAAAAAGSRSFRFDLSPEEVARARASHEAFIRDAAAGRGQAAGREAAAGEAVADGGVSELANAGNVGRETAAGAATGSVSEGVDLASQQLIQHIRSGTLDEMERAWIEAMAAGAAKAPGAVGASTQAILNEARAAGILGRDAAGTAGANGAAGAARGVP